MSKSRTKRSSEPQATATKRRLNVYLIAAIAALILAAAIAIPTALYVGSRNENAALSAALTDAEKQLELREDALNALEAQQRNDQSFIDELQTKIDDLLNIQEQLPVITATQIQEQLAPVCELVTQRYIYTSAARWEDSKTWLLGWPMPFTSTSLLVTYDGEIKAGIDFSQVKVSVEEATRTITVTLPSSKVLNNNIPQESINVLEVKNNLFNEVTFDDYNEFIGAEKPLMEDKAIEMGLLTDADREAEGIIRAFLSLIPGIDTYTLNIVVK